MNILVIGSRRTRARDRPQAEGEPRRRTGSGARRATAASRRTRSASTSCDGHRRASCGSRRKTRSTSSLSRRTTRSQRAWSTRWRRRASAPSAPARTRRSSRAARVFSKNLMKKYGIPTARYEVFSDPAAAVAYIEAENRFPVVVKADGLALGKGVLIAEDLAAAKDGRALDHGGQGVRRVRQQASSSRNSSRARRFPCSRLRTARRCARWSPRRTTSARWTATRA